MSEQKTTQLLNKIKTGSKYLRNIYDSDIDIAGPKQISITTGAAKADLTLTIQSASDATVSIMENVVLGTGGSVAAGTTRAFYARDRTVTTSPLAVIKEDYVLGDTGQSAGTEIYSEYHISTLPTVIKLKLKASLIYGIVFTTIADNNKASFRIEVDE